MTQSTFVPPMEMIAKHTVSVGGSYSKCMNCGENYLGGAACKGCGTVLLFLASEKIGTGVLRQMQVYANENGLALIGYSGGSCLEMGGGKLISLDAYPLM